MVSSYTTNLGIEKPAPGDQDGTWAGTNNTNFDLFDEAISGLVTITLGAAGSSGSPNDLPVTDGASSNGRNAFIEITDAGDLGADVFVQLTPNDSERIIFIKNNLSGSQDLILFQGTYDAGRDLIISAGSMTIVSFDGQGASSSTALAVLSGLEIAGLSGTNTGDNAGVTAVTAVGALASTGGNTPEISHSTSAGDKHVPTGGNTGQKLKNSAAGTAVWFDDHFSESKVVENPNTNDQNLLVMFTNVAITLTELRALIYTTGASPSIEWTLKHATTRDAAGTVIDNNTTTSETTGDDITSITDPTIPADSYIWLVIDDSTNNPNEFSVTLVWKKDL